MYEILHLVILYRLFCKERATQTQSPAFDHDMCTGNAAVMFTLDILMISLCNRIRNRPQP